MIVNVVDTETTGLDDQANQMIQFGLIRIELFEEQIHDHTEFLIGHPHVSGHPKAMAMNAHLLQRIADGEGKSVREALNYLEKLFGGERRVIAGKNPSFDRGFLKAFDFDTQQFHHRMIDPAAQFIVDTDTVPPSLPECLQRAGLRVYEETQHIAIHDCWDVVRLLWFKYAGISIQESWEEYCASGKAG